MKASERHAIRTQPWPSNDKLPADRGGFTAIWLDPIAGNTVKRHRGTAEDAIKTLKESFVPTVHVNDRTIPFYKFWKRKYVHQSY